jgi:hypothetical protein
VHALCAFVSGGACRLAATGQPSRRPTAPRVHVGLVAVDHVREAVDRLAVERELGRQRREALPQDHVLVVVTFGYFRLLSVTFGYFR